MKLKGKIVEENLKAEPEISAHKVPRIWAIVADQRIARIFKKNGDNLELIGEALPEKYERRKGTPDHSIGRIVSGGGLIRHKLAPHLAPGRHDAALFAHDLSLWLENAAQDGLFDRLVLVAAPRTLGDLRQSIGRAVQGRITAEINKELTGFNERDLKEELKEVLWF